MEKQGFPKERWSGPWVILSRNNPEGTSYKIYRQEDPTKWISTGNVRHMRPYYEQEDLALSTPGNSS